MRIEFPQPAPFFATYRRIVFSTADERRHANVESIPGIHGKRAVIMGAGPGGLCSAYVLTKAGWLQPWWRRRRSSAVSRRTIRRMTPVGEFKFDIGGHRWFTKSDELNDLFREVVGDELLWVDRLSRIYFDGRYVDYPLKISNALKAIGPVMAARAMADYWPHQPRADVCQPQPIISMEDAYIDQFGPTLYGCSSSAIRKRSGVCRAAR